MSTHRQYVSIADFNSPYNSAVLQGLGKWPTGRSYWSIANFRAPYDQGYFQDNTLRGFSDDVSVVARQIPTWMYAVAGLGLSYVAYKQYNKPPKKP